MKRQHEVLDENGMVRAVVTYQGMDEPANPETIVLRPQRLVVNTSMSGFTPEQVEAEQRGITVTQLLLLRAAQASLPPASNATTPNVLPDASHLTTGRLSVIQQLLNAAIISPKALYHLYGKVGSPKQKPKERVRRIRMDD